MSTSRPQHPSDEKNVLERGQAIVEYALIAVLVGIAFGLALAASAPVTGNLFNAVVNDLLRQTLIADSDVANATGFWQTVTKVYELTPTGNALPTNTPAAWTLTPTEGPSPTPTNTYTATVASPTPTPTLTPTQPDNYKDAPFLDTVDEVNWWRTDGNIPLGGVPWTAEYFTNMNLSGQPALVRQGIWEINYRNDFAPGFSNENNFSIRFTRTVEFANDTTLNFRVQADDGVRMFVNTVPVTMYRDGNSANSWVNQSATWYTGAAFFSGGNVAHTIVVEFFENSGDAVLRVDLLGGGANPDDASVNAGGAPNPGGTYSCDWGAVEDAADANTERKFFDNYTTAANGVAGSLCHLEWRGAVNISQSQTDMVLSFWDVWEFDNPGVDGWLEIGEYKPVNPSIFPPTLDRSQMVWTKIDLNRAGTANFNWTHNQIELEPLMASWTTTTTPGATRRLAFRFVMQIPAGVTADRRWFIDDIQFDHRSHEVYPTNKLWTLDNADERHDFIRTGAVGQSNPGQKSGWNLVSNNKFGMSGLAFHDSANDAYDNQTTVAVNPYTSYKRLSIAPNSNISTDMRVNSLEIDGYIDLTNAPNPDLLGNQGSRVLSFYHGYDLGPQTGLLVQYSTTPYGVGPADWKTFPDGVLREVTQLGTATAINLQEVVISLEGLPDDPPRIRIRFAMMIHAQAGVADGWWIDQIRLGRAESDRWLNYPIYDNGQQQGPVLFWRYTGTWAPTAAMGRPRIDAALGEAEISYSSSPTSNYNNSREIYLTTRWPLDLYNDTPGKTVLLADNGAIGTTNTFGAPAVNPVLTFYWRRELGSGDDLLVQWRRANDPDAPANWRTIWAKPDSMSGSTNRINKTWEPARVSLYPVLKQFYANGNAAPGVGNGTGLTDDDIYFRFVLKSDGSNNGPGIHIDDISIEEQTLWTWKLWPSNQNRTDPAVVTSPPSLGFGNGIAFYSEPDGVSDARLYNQDWSMGGEWASVAWEQRTDQGMHSFHDSPGGSQNRAPTAQRISGNNDYGDSGWYTPHQTYSVLELNRIFDLRATTLSTLQDDPTLSFWTRYHIGREDFIRVQVSVWDPREAAAIGSTQAQNLDNSMLGRCANITNITQCYENDRGWGAWTDIWDAGSTGSEVMSYGWRRISLSLRNYAFNPSTPGTAGKQIRIRFVYNAYTRTPNADGWYIDRVEVAHRLKAPAVNINTSNFEDRAESMSNWIGEGTWGLDPNLFLGGTGTPVNLGIWTARWWWCPKSGSGVPAGTPNCVGLGSGSGDKNKFISGAQVLLAQNPRPTPAHTFPVTGIGINYPDGVSPVAGWNRHDQLVAEFTTDINVDGINFLSGPRTFMIRSDEGVRLKIERIDPITGIPETPVPEWNIVNNWTSHAAMTDMAPFTFVLNTRYRVTLQHYDYTGAGLIQLTANQPRYSFSDSPKYSGILTPDTPALARANTSLLGRVPLNLTGFTNSNFPGLAITTKYRLDGGSSAVVEASSDGGFTWGNTGFSTDVFNSTGGLLWDSTSPSFNGVYGVSNPDTDPWELRLYNLNSYEGSHILLRFRLDRTGTNCYGRDRCTTVGNPTAYLADAYYDGWWIALIQLQRVNQ